MIDISLWWVWIIGALLLAILEVVAPAQLFLGFAIGAALVGLGLLAGVPALVGLPEIVASVPAMLLIFAVLSLVAWLALRPLMGIRHGQAKHFEHDINED